MRVVCRTAVGEDFGQTYRAPRGMRAHAQPFIVGTSAEAYALMGVVVPCFESVL